MTTRSCPVCSTNSSIAQIFMERNIDPQRMNEFSFASRKLPEFMCHKLVQCPTCDLVYVNDPPDESILAEAYHAAEFDSVQEAEDAAAAYDRAMKPLLDKLTCRSSALEIGTGTGVFLESLRNQSFETVVGVEPSRAAIDAAPEHRQAWIREGIFKESDFEPNSFDMVCCFMTLEHVRDPHEIVAAASRLLKPGGAIALVTHNYRAYLNRFLGKRSPIIDIEHMQLFSPKSIKELLERNGFETIEVDRFQNRYELRYWIRLLPVPLTIKHRAIKFLDIIGLADLKLSCNVGNMLTYGFRRQ